MSRSANHAITVVPKIGRKPRKYCKRFYICRYSDGWFYTSRGCFVPDEKDALIVNYATKQEASMGNHPHDAYVVECLYDVNADA